MRLRPAAVPNADDRDALADSSMRSERMYYGAPRHSGDSFSEYVREAGLDNSRHVPSRIDRGVVGMVMLVDLPKRECEVDFAFTRSAKASSPIGVLSEEPSSPHFRARMLWHRVKFEELEVCECSDDLDAQAASVQSSIKRTQGRANATLRATLSTPEVVAQREFRASQREKLEMWESALSGGGKSTQKRRRKVELSASMSHKLQNRLLESGSSEFAAYFQVQQMYSAARAEFAEASSTVRGKSAVVLPVDNEYTDAAITACNVREVHRKAIVDLNSALKIDDAATACEALEKVRVRLERIEAEQPTFLRVRVGLQKCNKRLDVMRGALMHAQKVAMGRSMYGDKLAEMSLCEIDTSEDDLKNVFDMIDADGSGALDREEIAKLIHYFQDDVPSETEVSDAMAFMDRDGSGQVEFGEFLWWWRERNAGEDIVQATQNIQSHFRKVAERRKYINDKYRVIQLQSRVRAKLGRKRYVRKRREMYERQAAADAETLRIGGLAASKIQSMWRGHGARKTAAQLREEIYFREMEAASLKIQASFRGLRGRRAGETQREYQKRLYNLNTRAVRMWMNRSLGAVFDCWTETVARIRDLRRRSMRRMAHGQVSLAFDTWYEYAEACRTARADAIHEFLGDLKKRVAEADPQEQFRRRLQNLGEHRLRTEAEVNSALDDYWTYRRIVYGDMDCRQPWREARMTHYMAWVESTDRAQLYFEDVPGPPASMLNARVQPKKGIMNKLRKEKTQVARGMLLRITATKAVGVGPHSYNVTVEPQQSLNVAAEYGQRLSCTLQPDAVTPAAAAEVDHLLDRSGTEPATVWSQRFDEQRLGEKIGSETLQWKCDDCRATFDIENAQLMRLSGSIAEADGGVEDCTRMDGSHPTRKVGIFAIGLKDVDDWRRADDADSEGTPIYVKYEWAIVKPAPPAVLVRVSLDPTAPPGKDVTEAPGWSTGALRVHVVRAEGLSPGDGGWDKPDPYAMIRLIPALWRGREQIPIQPEPQERKTDAKTDTLSPEWDESVEFTDNLLMAPSPDMAVFVTTDESEDTQQTTLRGLREQVATGSLGVGASVWWPALGRDLLDEDGDGDQDELNWITLSTADAELGISVAPEHGLAGAMLEIEVMDKDLLTKDDMVAQFPPLPLSSVWPLGKARPQDFWIEAGVAVRPPRLGLKHPKVPSAEMVARESAARAAFDKYDTNGNGLLERDEIVALLQNMGMVEERLSVASLGEVPDVDTMMAQVDTDGSGEVGFDEFFVWYEEQVAKRDKGDETSLLFRLSRSLG